MGINLNPFTWWTGASWGTMFYGLIGKRRMGSDGLGNDYYEGGSDTAGRPRRWVIYAGAKATAAFGAGLVRSESGSYAPAFLAAG